MAEKKDEIPSNEENRDHNSPADQNGRPGGEPVDLFSYDDLKKATYNFAYCLGKGTSGTVYMGVLKAQTDQDQDVEIVAVKKMDVYNKQSDKMFLKEAVMLPVLRHPNIVNLIGYSVESVVQRHLVYEFMPLGSLHDRLYDQSPDSKLTYWKTRMTIALGTAKALNYLHNEAKPPVVFIDLKSANILLDQSFLPKLSNFRTSEFNPMPPPDSALTTFYALLRQTDVYDFGVVLFELITGRSKKLGLDPFDWLTSKMSKLEEAVDQRMFGKYDMRSLGKAAHLTLACLRPNYNIRPDMRDVLQELNNM